MKILRTPFLILGLASLAGSLGACGGDDGANGDAAGGGDARPNSDGGGRPPPATDFARDVISTAIELDLAALDGKATIELAPSSTSTGAAFEVGDLGITSVTGAIGALDYAVADGVLSVGLPFEATQIVVEYELRAHDQFDGWDPATGLSFLWPTFCGNLFPCKSDPADGSTFTMTVADLSDGIRVLFPTSIPTPAPAYMVAIAMGDYTEVNLGTTAAGTQVYAWHLPGQEAATATGTANLRAVFDFFERTYGAYPFGEVVGSVSASWGEGAYGGMEHHPYWHVASAAWDVEEIHAHEAAHGWFGNGVRIACWEDFVLSEGLATYLAARALGEQGVDIWPGYDCQLAEICGGGGVTVALPATCGAIDILNDPLWSGVPYQKGAQFLREVAGVMGEDQLDAVIAAFYAAHVGQAANMDDLLDAIQTAAGAGATAELEALETAWLRTQACPTTPACTL